MATSQNGWPARPDLMLRRLEVDGVAFAPGILDQADVVTVLGYVAREFHQRVERLRNPGCWGFAFRENRNDPTSLSNHSSGTAIDCNAPQHPNGVPTAATFSPAQVDEVHRILAEVDHVVRWGGDFQTTPDAMHFEINTGPPALARVALKLREGEDKMDARDWQRLGKMVDRAATKAAEQAVERFLDEPINKHHPDGEPAFAGVTVREAIKKAAAT